MLIQRLVSDFYKILNQVKTEELPDGLKLPDSFTELVSEMQSNQYDTKTFAIMLKAMVCIVLQIHMHIVGKSFLLLFLPSLCSFSAVNLLLSYETITTFLFI